MNLRKLEGNDASEYFRLRLEGLKESPTSFGGSYQEFSQKSVESLAKTISERNQEDCNVLIGAFDTDVTLVGVAGIVQLKGKKVDHYSLLWGTYVVPNARRNGIAKALVKEAIGFAQGVENIEAIKLCVGSENIAAKALYTSLGFSTYGTEPKALKLEGQYYDEDMMVLHLD